MRWAALEVMWGYVVTGVDSKNVLLSCIFRCICRKKQGREWRAVCRLCRRVPTLCCCCLTLLSFLCRQPGQLVKAANWQLCVTHHLTTSSSLSLRLTSSLCLPLSPSLSNSLCISLSLLVSASQFVCSESCQFVNNSVHVVIKLEEITHMLNM